MQVRSTRDLAELARTADVDQRSVLRYLVGLTVRPRIAQRIRTAIEQHDAIATPPPSAA